MRAKSIFLILGIVLIAAFAALNMDEFRRQSVLSLGFTTVSAPLGLVLLGLLVATLLIFLATMMYMQSVNMIEARKLTRELSVQRELADKAEASRFTELRHYLETQAAQAHQREQAAASVLADRLAQTQAILINRLEQSDNATAAYIGQLSDQLERRPQLPVAR
ncbi:MAG: hypothetical protein JWP47_2626 [Polaromonas sp.]|jgi:uncharacterized integral membrane protein|nr:hypothetical protein [Polaromonas sp.]